MDIRQRLLVVFQAEAKEHLARIRTILGHDGPGTSGPDLDEVFRRAHSLKGAARAVDLRLVESLAHPLETLFARVREGGIRLDPAAMSAVHQALDGIEDGVAAQISGVTPASPERILEAIARVLEPRDGAANGAVHADVATEPPLPAAPAAPQTAAEAKPAGDAAKPGTPRLEAETIRVSAEIVERLHRSSGQLTTESMRQTLLTARLGKLGRQVQEIAHEWKLVRKASAATLRNMDANPELARLSRYVDFVERQVAAISKDTRDLALLQQRSAWSLRSVGEQLQQDVCGARMIVAEHVFDGFGKMMRELARDEGKELDFRASGLEVQADRLVLQALKDPLMHLLRNTLAHGIETAQERVKAGKAPAGAVSLRLETQGNKLIVAVEDDGRGIDLKQVTRAAVKNGLVTEEAAAALPAEEQMRLIFHPGISTTRAVNQLSGRGMGLNVVTEAVARLQGVVQVRNGARSGTVFTVTVPLSVSSNRLLLVKCGTQTFAIATHALERLTRVKTAEIVSIEGRPAVKMEGRLTPLTSLAHVLKLSDAGMTAERETVPVAVLKSGENRVAFAVDALVSEIEGVIKELGPIASKAGGLSGGIIMGDGSVVLVLNAAELIEAFHRMEKMPLLKTAAPAAQKRMPTILVVDDSMTTRTLEKSILEAHGYRVLVAVDGVEALIKLRSEGIDLVVSDVEMPRLDGFGLLQELKRDAHLSKVPIILVTSLEKREDKERGLALGADGYIVKQKFDQKVLLETVRQML